MSLKATLHRQLKLGLIARAIVCPRTGEVLDIRTAKFIVDRDGDPAFPLSPTGFAQLTETELADIASKGYTPETQEV